MKRTIKIIAQFRWLCYADIIRFFWQRIFWDLFLYGLAQFHCIRDKVNGNYLREEI